ncbi:hypothetical protein V501_00135 [Pseudogymnoascus sp. VKM F-4519 (FW-2642)]|nr:hypothetical protein V501_00135 [Pseudogymnoascus sp. VKM F-4519 (FW-2642)]
MGIPTIVEYSLSKLFYSARARDKKLFTRGPAFSDFPNATIDIESPEVGPSSSYLSVQHTQLGEERVPELRWSKQATDDVIAGIVQEYILIVEDPDAPLPTPITHGLYYSIPSTVTGVNNGDFRTAEDSSSTSTYHLTGGFKYGQNRGGKIYLGPRPLLGHGPHRYFFQLIALKEKVDAGNLSTVANKEELALEIQGKVIGWDISWRLGIDMTMNHLVTGGPEVFQGVVSKDEVEALTRICSKVAYCEVAFVYIASDGTVAASRDCRIRLFATDGGGAKGVVTIGFIQKLQEALDPKRPVQENAGLSIGTSTGGVINLGLFGKNWTPNQCLTFFRKFAKIIFASKAKARFSIWSWISLCSWVSWIMRISGGRYDADILEKFLQEAYGTTPMFHTARPSGMKYAVTATTLSDATLCLISNYHTKGKPTSNLGYKHLAPTSDKGEILIWEAARCTTAAPTIFKPKRLRSFGTFQDGGLRNNNPVRPGLRLVSRIWEDGDCDIVLSIGNGFEQKPLSPVASNFRNLFLDGALARLYRASMESLSLNGQNSWDDHWHGLDEETKTNHFRLNLPLQGKEPGIDDIDSMDSLYQKTMCHQGDMMEIVRAFKGVTFFFELDRTLVDDGPFYICYGSILSRSPGSPRFIQLLTSDYPYAQFFNHGTSLGYISKNDICKLCGRYTKLVAFRVRHSSDQADIYLRFNRLSHRRISAFPKPIDWFIKRQKLNAKFGQPNHKSTVEPRQSDCSCQLQRKRDIPISLAGNLKRRLVTRTRTRRKKIRGNGD